MNDNVYIVITINERNGEYEYQSKVLMTLGNDIDKENFIDEYAKNWYGAPELATKEEHATYFLNGGECYVSADYKECTFEEYEILKKFL